MGDAAADFKTLRERMVHEQIAGRGIGDPRVLLAMRRVPRHAFVPKKLRPAAYEDGPLGIGQGQTISQPYMVALMTEMLELEGDENVLEIGTGSGYQTAILAVLANRVTTIERHAALLERAAAILKSFSLNNVETHVGDGTLGFPPNAPYDAILVTAGGPDVPPSLKEQLAVGGRLICPVGGREHQEILRLHRTETGFVQEPGVKCAFVPLIGEEGW